MTKNVAAVDAAPVVPRAMVLRGAQGLKLSADAYGDPSSPPVLLLHGGGQTRHAWDATCTALANAGFLAIAMDLRGHGESEWSPDGDYTIDAFAADLHAVIDELSQPPALVGASLGGITSLVVEGESERSRASAVVLVDVAPRLEPEGVVKIVSFMRAAPDGFASLEEAADAIAAYLPHRKRPRDLSGLAKNLKRGDDGRYRWHWDPRFLQERRPHMGNATDRLQAAARKLSVPTLLVRGKLSDLVSKEGVTDFLALVPHAEFVDVAGAGHMVAGDRNDAFSDAVVDFLVRARPLRSA